MQTTHKLSVKDLEPRTLWITPNITIYRQLSFWYATLAVYQFVPTTCRGLIIVSDLSETIECKPLQGYIVSRPVSLMLSWPVERTVTFRQVSLYDARLWQARAHYTFQDVAKNHQSKSL